MSDEKKQTVAIAAEETTTENIVSAPEPEGSEGPGVAPLDSGAIGSTTVKFKAEPTKAEATQEKKADKKPTVALYSNGNIHWEEVGSLSKGYNFVTKLEADKWLTLDSIRLATPDEIAKEFKDE
jgi:hypothetical protein